MGKGRTKTSFPDENGVDRYFDQKKCRRYYDDISLHTRGGKTYFLNEIAINNNYTYDAVKAWIYGYNSPSSIDAVHALEKGLNLSEGDLLMFNEEKEENTMRTTRNIGKEEKKAARKLYHKMNKMICSIRYHYGDFHEFSIPTEKTELQNIADAIRGEGKIYRKKRIRDYSDKCIIAIRKSAFDLPENLRQACLDLVYDTLGRGIIISDLEKAIFNSEDISSLDVDAYATNSDGNLVSFPEMFSPFRTNDYKAYEKKLNSLKKPGVKYEDPSRGEDDWVVFSALQIEKSFDKLDEIFKDYLVK